MDRTLKGLFKSITVSEQSIIISKNNGNKIIEFPINEVSNFIFEKGTTFKYGYLTICTLDGKGYNIDHRKSASDKNSITFNSNVANEFELVYLKLRSMVTLKTYEELKPEAVEAPEIRPINIGQSQPVSPQYGTESGHAIKMCLNCGERLLQQAKKCPTCGAKAKDFPIINSNDTGQIRQIKENAPHSASGSTPMWEKNLNIKSQIWNNANSESKPTTSRERIKENKANAVACCPKCGSTSLSGNKKGFGVGKAAIGVLTIGKYGAVAGGMGSNKVIVTCLNCGHHWKA